MTGERDIRIGDHVRALHRGMIVAGTVMLVGEHWLRVQDDFHHYTEDHTAWFSIQPADVIRHTKRENRNGKD